VKHFRRPIIIVTMLTIVFGCARTESKDQTVSATPRTADGKPDL